MISVRATANAIAAASVLAAALLYKFSPQEYSFYPRCPVYALTHHLCPGCGATRAVAELLHGHLAAALHFNAAVVVLLPLLLCYFAKMYFTAIRENRVDCPPVPRWSWQVALAAVAVFAVARNFA